MVHEKNGLILSVSYSLFSLKKTSLSNDSQWRARFSQSEKTIDLGTEVLPLEPGYQITLSEPDSTLLACKCYTGWLIYVCYLFLSWHVV